MLKWVVKSGHSPNNHTRKLEAALKSSEKNGNHSRDDSLLDNSDSLLDWQPDSNKGNLSADDTSTTSSTEEDHKNYKCKDKLSHSEVENLEESELPAICHGLNADSGIYTNSQLDESFSNDDSNRNRLTQLDTSSDDATSTTLTDCTRDDPLSDCTRDDTFSDYTRDDPLSDTYSLGTCSLDFNDVSSRRIGTRSLDFDAELTDQESLELGGYHSEADSLDLENVFTLTEEKQNCVTLKKVVPKKVIFARKKKKNTHRRLSVEDKECEDVHQKRSRLVEQIDRETKLRLGAENLFKATDNKRLKQTVETELKFIQSHIKLLTDELDDLDTAMESRDVLNAGAHRGFPMIQVGLKETKDIDFHYAFKNFIEDHYYEDGEDFNKQIEAFETLRQMIRNPLPTEEGTALLFDYYNHLYFIDKRFFPPGRGIGIYFPWFDAVTGSLTTQRTMGFEKGCILFNIAALYSQIAAHKRRVTEEDCRDTAGYLQKAAGVLKYLHDSFSYAPSTDMQSHTLKILIHLMLTQAQECLLEIIMHKNNTTDTLEEQMQFAQESAKVYDMYKYARQLMHFDCITDYIPHKWHMLVQVKTLYFKAICNYYAALTILSIKALEEFPETLQYKICDMFEEVAMSSRGSVHQSSETLEDHSVSRYISGTDEERRHLAKACLGRSVLAHEEALKVHCQHQRVKRIPYYHDVHQLLKNTHDRCFQKYSELDEEEDFTELSFVPNIKAKSSQVLQSIAPDLSAYKVQDPFKALGPMAIFCARHYWSEPYRVELHKKADQEFGFSVRGEQPVIVAEVDTGSLAEKSGIRPGDFIVYISKQNVKWRKHDEVVNIIRNAGQNLVLNLITPLDKNYLNPPPIKPDDNGNVEKKPEKSQTANFVNRHVMQSGTLDRNKPIRLSGRSTKSLSYTLRKLKPLQLNHTGKNKDKRQNLQEAVANWDNRNKR